MMIFLRKIILNRLNTSNSFFFFILINITMKTFNVQFTPKTFHTRRYRKKKG